MVTTWGRENILTYAAHYRNKNVVEFFIKEVFFEVDFEDLDGNTALIAATENGNTQIVLSLLELGADKFHKNSEGKTAYDYAVEQGFVELAEILKP